MTLEYVIRTLEVNKITYVVKNYKIGYIFVEPNHHILIDINSKNGIYMETEVSENIIELGFYKPNELIAFLKG